jgi:hypothetical protein
MIQGCKSYLTDVKNAVLGRERFENIPGQPDSGFALAGLIFYMIIMVVFFVAYSYGAARLSYCYNIYSGETSGTATLWSILAFLFSGYYYPIYGVFLSPICDLAGRRSQVGGKKYR